MATAGIITFLHNDNYGSSLQAYALQHVLGNMGIKAEHLDYQPDSFEKLRNLLYSGNSPKLILEGLRKRRVKTNQAGAREKGQAIPAFYRRQMRLSPKCPDYRSLRRQITKYELLICGSDQIWNPVWLNAAYFLPFSSPEQKKIAYAASLGVKTLPSLSKQKKMRKWIAGFDAVSVRETEGADLLEEMTGSRPAVMPDPVCLLTRKDWEELAEPVSYSKPYLLCYFIGEKPEYWESVRKIQAEKKLDVLVVPVTAESYSKGFRVLDGIGPATFLGALFNAAAVCTDSFHCFVFSNIFEKECAVCRRDHDDDPESRNSRIDSFSRELEKEGLEGLRKKGLSWLEEQVLYV